MVQETISVREHPDRETFHPPSQGLHQSKIREKRKNRVPRLRAGKKTWRNTTERRTEAKKLKTAKFDRRNQRQRSLYSEQYGSTTTGAVFFHRLWLVWVNSMFYASFNVGELRPFTSCCCRKKVNIFMYSCVSHCASRPVLPADCCLHGCFRQRLSTLPAQEEYKTSDNFLLFPAYIWIDINVSTRKLGPSSGQRRIRILTPKTIRNRKRDCAWGCARGINTTWENLQIEKHKSGRRAFHSPDWLVLFDLQLSQVVFIDISPGRNLTHNLFFYFQ